MTKDEYEARVNGDRAALRVIDEIKRENGALLDALEELVARCDGLEGVRADGSNIQTIHAHAALAKAGRE